MKILLFFLVIIFIVILLSFLYKKFTTSKFDTFLKSFSKPKTIFIEDFEPDIPIPFGYKNVWFAVKATNKKEIADLLDLEILGNANWQNGIKYAYDYRIFISPEVNGWTLITGNGLHFLFDNNGEDIGLCNKLSLKYGESHFFNTHRITEYHIWAKSIDGVILRYFSYLGERGEILKNLGKMTTIENEIQLEKFISYNSNQIIEEDDEDENYCGIGEETVMKIAESWSVNPSELGKYENYTKELGLVCELK